MNVMAQLHKPRHAEYYQSTSSLGRVFEKELKKWQMRNYDSDMQQSPHAKPTCISPVELSPTTVNLLGLHETAGDFEFSVSH